MTIPFFYQSHPDADGIDGRLQIQIHHTIDGNESDTHKVAHAVKCIEATILAKRSYDHIAFKAFIPFNTRSLGEACKSLFLPITLDHLKNTSGCGYLLAIVTLICDLATLTFRLLTITFRAIYQNTTDKQPELQGVKVVVTEGSGTIDWSRGVIRFKTYGTSKNADDGGLVLTNTHSNRVYLG